MATIEQTMPDQPLERARLLMSCGAPTIAHSPVTVRNNQAVTEWLEWMRDSAGRAPQTVYNYASLAAKYLDGCVGARPLDAVTVDEIEAWLLRPRERRAKGRVGAPATRARNVAVLKSMYRWLHARGYVATDVGALLVAPKVQNRQPKAIADGLWLKAWAGTAEDQMTVMLGLGFFLGLRRAEIASMHTDHVDVARRQLVNFPRKGGGEDTMPAGEVLEVWQDRMPQLLGGLTADDLWNRLEGLKAHPLGRDGNLLGLWSPDAMNYLLKQYLAAIGLEGAFTPHALRHSFVTNLLRCGMPIEMVSELANHSDLSVTMRYVKQGGGRVREWRESSTLQADAQAQEIGQLREQLTQAQAALVKAVTDS